MAVGMREDIEFEEGHSSAPMARAAQSSTRPAHFSTTAFRSLPRLGVETHSQSW